MRFNKFTFAVTLLLYISIASTTIIRVPQDQPTIQAGIDAAIQGDTVLSDTGISSELLELEQHVLELVNQYRISQNLQELTIDHRISQQARKHSRAMANKQVLVGHYGFDLRVNRISIFLLIRSIAENVAYHQGCSDCAQRVVQGWLDSSEHLKTIEGDYSMTGVGIARDLDGGYYFTQIFCKEGRLIPRVINKIEGVNQ